MSKIEAYICNKCNALLSAEKIVGISILTDIFDSMLSYPVSMKPEKCDVHLCTDCYRTQVTEPAERQSNRKTDEYLYTVKVKELSYNLRHTAVMNWQRGRKKREK